MAKLTKNRKLALSKIEPGKTYSLKEAATLLKEITTTKFDASVDIDVRLNIDPRKANQMVRGTVILPHGTGKEKKFSCCVRLRLKPKPKKQGPIMWDSMNTSKKLKRMDRF